MKSINLLLIGCGPHSQRVYLPAISNLSSRYPVNLKVVVELEVVRSETEKIVDNAVGPGTKFIYTPPFKQTHKLPQDLKARLNALIRSERINGVIIATEPLAHMQYAIWAESKGLHILLDKPISTYTDVSRSRSKSDRILKDYQRLHRNRSNSRAFIVNSQRRYHPGFAIVSEKILEVAKKYRIPITSIQSMDSDGQWRMPKEIITQDYHPYNVGYGKVSHSGYHIIDVVATLSELSFRAAGKSFDKIGVFSSFIRPRGLLYQLTRLDYVRIFGHKYRKANELDDNELNKAYKSYGEIDSSSIITFFNQGEPVSNIAINLIHNGFSRRNWLLPRKDLYKGNGRVKHEYHNIQQGPFQNIQIHSYQSSDQHDKNTVMDYALGGNNHFDIYIFRNSRVMGGKAMQVIKSADISKKHKHDHTKLLNEVIKQKVVEEFFQIISGERKPTETASDLSTQLLTATLMSMIYRAGTNRKEAFRDYEIR